MCSAVTLEMGHPWCVQIELNPKYSPAAGCVMTVSVSAIIAPPPTGTFARAIAPTTPAPSTESPVGCCASLPQAASNAAVAIPPPTAALPRMTPRREGSYRSFTVSG
ncbi:hypothetical protein ACFPRL_29330 [Pseudoclavibacter helvolus]